jgi:hypothetical protein
MNIGGHGNYTFTLQVVDSGINPPSGDQYSLTVYDQNNVPYRSFGLTVTQGGNIVAHLN